jgi:hypothetical protein
MPLKTAHARLAFLLPLAAILAATPTARADGIKQACVDASSEGQALRDASKLRRARDRFVLCARDECPAIVRKYCAEWLTEVERRLPTVIFRAQTAAGADAPGAQLSIDGVLQPSALGIAIPLDPGEHTVHVERDGGGPLDQKVVVLDGEKGRVVPLRFPAPPHAAIATNGPGQREGASSPSKERGPIPPWTWVSGGVGVAGLAGFVVFGLMAQGDLNHLKGTCAPYCDPSQLDSVKREALIADISLGVGVAALAVMVYTLVTWGGEAASGDARIDVRAVPGGGVAGVVGRF